MQYDLVIVGGGAVGMTLAKTLQHTSLRIALIDARAHHATDVRLFALNWSSCQLLKNIGLWPLLQTEAEPIREVHVSRQSHLGVVRFRHELMSLPALGYVIPAAGIESALQQALPDLSQVTLYRPASLIALKEEGEYTALLIRQDDQETVLHARYVIGADGTSSTVRKLMHIKADHADDASSALVTHTQLSRSHQGIAYERFNQEGAIAMLPLPGETCATIWSADCTTIANLHALSDTAFLTALQNAFGHRLGRLRGIGERVTFPLSVVKAKNNLAGSVLLLGNAAHTVHPIAAQGLNMSFYEIATIAENITDRMIHLEKISQHIQSHITVNLHVSHALPRWLMGRSPWVSALLSVGMLGLDSVTSAKRMLLTPLLGRAGRVPRLLLSAGV